jgi:hypothetical protein
MSTAREQILNGLLLEGLGKPVDLNAVDWHVRHRNPSASPSEVQNETQSLDHSIHKISHAYVEHYDDPERWMFSAWLSLTAKGELLARSLEEKDIDSYRSRGT